MAGERYMSGIYSKPGLSGSEAQDDKRAIALDKAPIQVNKDFFMVYSSILFRNFLFKLFKTGVFQQLINFIFSHRLIR